MIDENERESQVLTDLDSSASVATWKKESPPLELLGKVTDTVIKDRKTDKPLGKRSYVVVSVLVRVPKSGWPSNTFHNGDKVFVDGLKKYNIIESDEKLDKIGLCAKSLATAREKESPPLFEGKISEIITENEDGKSLGEDSYVVVSLLTTISQDGWPTCGFNKGMSVRVLGVYKHEIPAVDDKPERGGLRAVSLTIEGAL